MSKNSEAKRPIDSNIDPDPRRNQNLRDTIAIVAQLQRGMGVEQIKAVMVLTGKPQSLAQSARSGGQGPGR